MPEEGDAVSGRGKNPGADFLRVVSMVMNPLAEAGRRFGEWYERNQLEIRRFSDKRGLIILGC